MAQEYTLRPGSIRVFLIPRRRYFNLGKALDSRAYAHPRSSASPHPFTTETRGLAQRVSVRIKQVLLRHRLLAGPGTVFPGAAAERVSQAVAVQARAEDSLLARAVG